MSARNSLEAKRERKAVRSTKSSPDAYIDLVNWVKSRSSVTSTQAVAIILSGALRVDSHKIGVTGEGNQRQLVRYVPADLRGRIQIVTDHIDD